MPVQGKKNQPEYQVRFTLDIRAEQVSAQIKLVFRIYPCIIVPF